MKALLITQGSHGDINPFIAIGQALRARGHDVLLTTNPYFETQIGAAGLSFAPLGEHVDLKQSIAEHDVMDPQRGPLNLLRKFLLPHVPEHVRRTRELVRELRPDVVVYHPIVIGAPWACALEGPVPTVSITPSPTLWATPGDPLVLLPNHSDSPGPAALWLGRFMSKWFLRFVLDGDLNRLRRELGLGKERDQLWGHARNATLNLGVWSPLLRPPLPGDPARSAVVGFTWHDRDRTQEAPDSELDAFFAAGAPPIVFALGSTGVHAAGRFYECAVEASVALGQRALLVVGRDQPAPPNMPRDGGIKAVAYAPFSSVFRRSSVVVHHGGVGTTAQGLVAGRPTLIMPMAHDQFDNAARAKRLGVSETLHFAKLDTPRLTALLGQLIREPRYAAAAAALAPRIAAEDGARRAAELIEAVPATT
jgi:UDP:flavonoid glycosyltransferase YjiC (YdhE family)